MTRALFVGATLAISMSLTPLQYGSVQAAASTTVPAGTPVFRGDAATTGAADKDGRSGKRRRGHVLGLRDILASGPDQPGYACDGSASVDDSGTGYGTIHASVGTVSGDNSNYTVTVVQDKSNSQYGMGDSDITHTGNGYGHWIEGRVSTLSLGGGSNNVFDWGFDDPNANFYYNYSITGLNWNGSVWRVHHEQNNYFTPSTQPGEFAYLAEYIDCSGKAHFYLGQQWGQLTEVWKTNATLTSGLTQPYYVDAAIHTSPANPNASATITDQQYYDGIPANVSITNWNGASTTVTGSLYASFSSSPLTLGSGSPTTNATTCSTSRPVNCDTGDFWHTFADLSLPGRGLPLDFTQTYNSLLAAQDSPLGFGWTDSYNLFLSMDGNGTYTVHEESGSSVSFSCSSTCDGPSWVFGHLVANGDGTYTFTRAHSQDRYVFAAPTQSTAGALLKEIDRNGYTTTLSYTGNQLTAITDPEGRSLTLTYNTSNRVATITDPTNRSVSFIYDSSGNLTDVTDVGGGDTHFSYDSNHLLLTMEDPRQYAASGALSSGPVVTNVYDTHGRVTQQTDPMGRSTTFSYTTNPDGSQTTTTTEPNNNVEVETYQNDELITGVVGSGTSEAATTSYVYDPVTLGITSLTDPNGHVWKSTYDGNGNTLSSTDPLGHVTTATYDSLNDVTSITDANNATTTFSYDANGNVLSVARPLTGGAPHFTSGYSTAVLANTPAVYYRLDEISGPTMYDASGNGRNGTYKNNPTFGATGAPNDGDQAISMSGASTSSSGSGLPTGSQARTLEAWFKWTGTGSGYQTVVEYGPQSHYNKVAMGVWDSSHVWFSAYDLDWTSVPAGKTINDGSWHQLVFTYDGSTTGTLYLDGVSLGTHTVGTLNTTIGANGLVLGANDSGGDNYTGSVDEVAVYPSALTAAQVGAHYSAASAPAPAPPSNGCTPPAPAGPRTSAAATAYLGYDPAHPGDVTAVSDAKGTTTGFAYDTDGNLTSVCNPVGDLTTYGYDTVGRMISEVSPNGNVPGGKPSAFTTTATYNAYDQPLTVTDPLGHTTTSTYDADGNLATVQDARSNLTTYTYDPDNELTIATRPDSSTESFTYDGNGNTLSQTDGLNQTTSSRYDPLNRVISTTDPLQRQTTYSYDAASNLTSVIDAQSRTTTYGYDIANRLTGISYSDASTPNVTLGYDADNQRTSMTDGTGSSSYAYDSLGRLVQSTDGAGNTSGYGYDLAGNLLALTYPGGTQVTRTYDQAARLTGITDWLHNTTAFGYDANGNLTGEIFPASTNTSASLTYNAADALTRIVDARSAGNNPFHWVFGYGRDPVGQVSEATDRMPGMQHSYSYDPLNRLTGDTTGNRAATTWTYDAADELKGSTNAATNTASTYGYDSAQELNTLQTTQGSTTIQQLTLSYNNDGDRIGQTDSVTGASATFGYDQADRLISYAKGSTSATYTYNGDGLRMAKTVNGTSAGEAWDLAEGLPLMLQEGSTKYITQPDGLPLEQVDGSGNVTYYLQDQLSSTRGLIDSTGTIIGEETFDAWGKLGGEWGQTTPFGYAGQYTDSESGLQYLRARYYDPQTSQFLTVDPLVGVTGEPYAYVSGDPLNLVDPTGLFCISIDCVKVGIGAVVSTATSVLGLQVTPAYAPPADPIARSRLFENSGGPRCGNRSIPGLGSVIIGTKIRNQMADRGWTEQDIYDAIQHPAATASTIDKTAVDQPATSYYRSDGYYVVRNDQTGNIVQISDRNDPGWIDPTTNQPVRPIQSNAATDGGPVEPIDPIDPELPIDPLLP